MSKRSKMPNQKSKPEQKRRTYLDVRDSQLELLELVRIKIHRGVGLASSEENRFAKLYTDSVMGYGSVSCKYEAEDGTVLSFTHIDDFVFRYLIDATKEGIPVKDPMTGEDVIIPIRDAWNLFREIMIYIGPYARRQAMDMSVEAPIREEATAHSFSLDRKIE